MLRPYLKIREWEWIFGCAVKAISSPDVRSPCTKYSCILLVTMQFCFVSILLSNTAVSSFGASLEVGTNI